MSRKGKNHMRHICYNFHHESAESRSVLWMHKLVCLDKTVFASIFSSPGQRPCELLPSLGVRPSYVVNFNFLLRNHWANCNQTLVEWYLYGPLPKLCPLIPTSNQDGHQA